jgi:hypothetical protein
MRDAVDQGTHYYAVGEEQTNSKLTDEAVKEIKATYFKYGQGLKLAKKFGVSIFTIRDAAKGRSWKHVV